MSGFPGEGGTVFSFTNDMPHDVGESLHMAMKSGTPLMRQNIVFSHKRCARYTQVTQRTQTNDNELRPFYLSGGSQASHFREDSMVIMYALLAHSADEAHLCSITHACRYDRSTPRKVRTLRWCIGLTEFGTRGQFLPSQETSCPKSHMCHQWPPRDSVSSECAFGSHAFMLCESSPLGSKKCAGRFHGKSPRRCTYDYKKRRPV